MISQIKWTDKVIDEEGFRKVGETCLLNRLKPINSALGSIIIKEKYMVSKSDKKKKSDC